MRNNLQHGMINPLLIMTIVLSVFTVGLGGFSLWAFVNYQDQKNNVDAKLSAAVASAKQQQSTEDEKLFAEREKEPTRELVGPADLGRVSLKYPKTWSVYLEKDGGNRQYEAFLHPGIVPATNSGTSFALRISIDGRAYDEVIATYQDRVKKGDLKAAPIAIQGENGTRLDGTFSKDVQGSMVLFKVRDKTLRVYTEAKSFQPDFDNIVLPSLNFNK